MGSDASDGALAIVKPAGVATGPVAEFALSAVTPNPARGMARAFYALPRPATIRLSVVDVQGRELAVLAEGLRGSGRYEARWDGSNQPAGVYFVRFEGGGRRFMSRLVLSH